MPVTTIHQFIDNYPVSPTDTRMILGTIHPHNIANFNIDFFYGNVGSFWDILGNAFPQHNFNDLPNILNILQQYNIWVSDIIRQCDRIDAGVTQDKLLYNIQLNQEQVQNALFNSPIDTIYFTSRFGENNAAKLFVDTFNIPYRNTFDINLSEFVIPANYFGRQIRCVVLYSPSNNANVGISQSAPYLFNIDYYSQFETPVKQFKIEFYQDKFDFLND